MGNSGDQSTSQLVQAMAAFGPAGAIDGSATALPGAEASLQASLAAPMHA